VAAAISGLHASRAARTTGANEKRMNYGVFKNSFVALRVVDVARRFDRAARSAGGRRLAPDEAGNYFCKSVDTLKKRD